MYTDQPFPTLFKKF
uniref:Uncharacterized protein n=1 Tax=Arundo donax TaxID=35708 RepID=A0A0A8ZFJ9_ARUDO